MDKIDKLADDSLFMSDLETIEMHEKEQCAIRAYGKKLATDKGLVQGIVQNTKEMILSMIENKIDIELISKITKKTIEEINKIIKY